MSNRPHILITNDDGIWAPGIKHLYHCLKDLADITIVAPASEQSGRALGITIYQPIRCHSVKWEDGAPAWAVEGTPVDCVKMAVSTLCDRTPDLIVAGINAGSNAGRNLLYSGTVGTVIEGALKGIQGIAFSCLDTQDPHFQQATRYIPGVVEHVFQQPLPEGTVLNVNFPSKKTGECKGIKIARHGNGFWADAPMERHDHNGVRYYWLGGQNHALDEKADSDVALLELGYAAAVPVQVRELTNLTELHARQEAFEKLSGAVLN